MEAELTGHRDDPAPGPQHIADYLAGRLPQAAAEALEEYCVLHPEVAADIEAERLLRAGMREAVQTAVPAAAAARRAGRQHLPVWIPIAAALALAVVGLLVFRQGNQTHGPLLQLAEGRQAAAGHRLSQLVLVRLRGTAPTLSVSAGDGIAEVEVRLDAATVASGPLRIVLERRGADDRWIPLGVLTANGDTDANAVRFALALGGIDDGRLRVSVSKASGATPDDATNCEFNLRRDPVPR